MEKDGYLTENDYSQIDWGENPEKVDYEKIYQNKFKVFRKAFSRFSLAPEEDFENFCCNNSNWLDDYAFYMALKIDNNDKPWYEWDEKLIRRDEDTLLEIRKKLKNEIFFWKMIQYFFFKQWNELKAYANSNGVKIIGDIPIYVAADSADVWANPKNFLLDENCTPIDVAGCPPDAFTADGQLWGNPLYDWQYMKKDGYTWWKSRIDHLCNICDVIRIDHFRGFESFYCIPYGAKNAKIGEWRKGPGIEFFREIEKSLGKKNIIAEDLGFLTPQVKTMLRQSKYPGMKILQFAFDSDDDNDYTLHNITKNSVAYTGTHDNDTVIGYLKKANRKTKKRAKDYLRLSRREGYNWGMMKAVWSSNADTAIVTMQDLVGLGSEARMNFPSTTSDNWQWRALPDYIDDELAEKVRYNTELYKRLPCVKKGKKKCQK